MKKDATTHPIQLAILDKLNYEAVGKRYSQLNSMNIEDDLFNYHLQKLVKSGLIKKTNQLYSLDTRGKIVASNITNKGVYGDMFKFSVTVNVFKEINGVKYILAQDRGQFPAMHDTTTIAGKILKGEIVEDAARRQMLLETGLIIDKVFIVGILRKTRYDTNNKLIDDVIYNVCYAENPTGDLQSENVFGKNRWMKVEEFLEKNSKSNDVGEYDRIAFERLIAKDLSLFYFHERLVIEDY